MQQANKETIGMYTLFICIIIGIQWLLIWLTHWTIALIASELIALVVVCFFVALSHASPNGGSKGPATDAFIKPLLLIGGILLLTFWMLSYLMHKEISNMVVVIPLILLVTIGIILYMYKYISIGSYWEKNYSLCDLEIEYISKQSTNIQYIKFNNSSGYSMDIKPNALQWPTTYIPQNMNKISFRFISNESNRSVVNEFPFNYSLCQETTIIRFDLLFWIRKKRIAPMKFLIFPENKVDLYIDNQLIKKFKLSDTNDLKNR